LPRVDRDSVPVTDAPVVPCTGQGSREGEPMKAESAPIPEGSRVRLMSDGREVGSGVLDVCMPDGSACWIWLDDGAGRRLVHERDAVQIVVPVGPVEVPSTVIGAS
jgi:hypothetical protein